MFVWDVKQQHAASISLTDEVLATAATVRVSDTKCDRYRICIFTKAKLRKTQYEIWAVPLMNYPSR
jgi:hypothetical protein